MQVVEQISRLHELKVLQLKRRLIAGCVVNFSILGRNNHEKFQKNSKKIALQADILTKQI